MPSIAPTPHTPVVRRVSLVGTHTTTRSCRNILLRTAQPHKSTLKTEDSHVASSMPAAVLWRLELASAPRDPRSESESRSTNLVFFCVLALLTLGSFDKFGCV